MRRFEGRKVLVTGSTRGIGRAAVERFLAEGAEVIVHGVKADAVNQAVVELSRGHGEKISGLAADLSDRAACAALCEDAGDVDVLVNCAGIYEERPASEVDASFWRRMIEINVTAPWLLSRGLLDGLRRRRGVIVNIASDAGLVGYAGATVYCASKGALIGLTRALAVELAPDVRALAVCPGPVETDMYRATIARAEDKEAAKRAWTSGPLLQRLAQPEEIAAAIAFAASPDCGFATGNLIVMDGGVTAGRRIA